jgi:hypothetical protein
LSCSFIEFPRPPWFFSLVNGTCLQCEFSGGGGEAGGGMSATP